MPERLILTPLEARVTLLNEVFKRLILTPLEARVTLLNEVFSGEIDSSKRRGHYSEAVARALHGSGWRSWYHPENKPINPEDILRDSERSQLLVEKVDQILYSLTDRERLGVIRRFGLDGEGIRNLTEVGSEFGVRRERARQITSKAVRKLRHPSRSRSFVEFLPAKQ